MKNLMTIERLDKENIRFRGKGGVSHENRCSGFLPAFCDTLTGRSELSRFEGGTPAPLHLFDGLPEEWVMERSSSGAVVSIKSTVVAGFLRNGCFFTREEAARQQSN